MVCLLSADHFSGIESIIAIRIVIVPGGIRIKLLRWKIKWKEIKLVATLYTPALCGKDKNNKMRTILLVYRTDLQQDGVREKEGYKYVSQSEIVYIFLRKNKRKQ